MISSELLPFALFLPSALDLIVQCSERLRGIGLQSPLQNFPIPYIRIIRNWLVIPVDAAWGFEAGEYRITFLRRIRGSKSDDYEELYILEYNAY
jgi:hypothetical protein